MQHENFVPNEFVSVQFVPQNENKADNSSVSPSLEGGNLILLSSFDAKFCNNVASDFVNKRHICFYHIFNLPKRS